ncbi:ParB family protein [Mannheimia glucosida]|uniref:ParB family protein n=1 Tax=Mannheimia glucosida TaxID=85401 RepID=UPI003917E871
MQILNNKEAQRKQQMLKNLMQGSIKNTSVEYNQPTHSVLPETHRQLISVTLDKLKPFEGNPRKTKNPKYEEIKASIKARGLDHAPNVTKRPGDDFYTVADGGNTRLQALKELFEETQDPKFWSIDCVFKPWQGEADDISSRIDTLVGHLAENEVRGDLSFVEKALGVRDVKALYEEKFQENFSHRKLADTLTEQGYPISHQLIARMEQCLVYLYPHIPNVLLSGLGKPQIEKLLTIHRNGQNAWDNHQYQVRTEPTGNFDETWVAALSPMDEEPDSFSVTDFQDNLIGAITEAFGYQLEYSVFKAEIDLEERKLLRLREKQAEIAQQALESEQRLAEPEPAKTKAKSEPVQSEIAKSKSVADDVEFKPESDNDSEEPESEFDTLSIGSLPTFEQVNDSEDVTESVLNHFADLGMQPGVNPEAERAVQAVENGLEFANIGRQPVSNIWKIYPSRQHKMEAYSLALDIADELGFIDCIEHVVKEPVDYSFRVKTLTGKHSDFVQAMHGMLVALSTDQIESADYTQALSISSIDLLGTLVVEPAISDLLLVRLFRLIRLTRYIKQQARGA